MPAWPVPIGYRNIDLGLDRVYELLDRLGNPHTKLPPVVHVAGTNGKGSTIAFMRAILEDAGHRVHVYSSPHLVEFNERYVVGSEIVSDGLLNDVLEECKQAAGKDIKVTFFEGTTVAAFLLFSRIEADIVLLETGLGGRLDATNVVAEPALTLITSISMDHMDFLGNSLKEIAAEKAGIMKKSVVTISTMQDKQVQEVLEQCAQEVGSALQYVKPSSKNLNVGLVGEHQQRNAQLAIEAVKALKSLNISPQNIEAGLLNVQWPARMQLLTKGNLVDLAEGRAELWLDGGHNQAAGKAMAFSLSHMPEMATYAVCAMIAGKDYEAFLNEISSAFLEIHCVDIPDEPSSMDKNILAQAAENKGLKSQVHPNVASAISNILDQSHRKVRIVICGSLYLAGTVLASNS